MTENDGAYSAIQLERRNHQISRLLNKYISINDLSLGQVMDLELLLQLAYDGGFSDCMNETRGALKLDYD